MTAEQETVLGEMLQSLTVSAMCVGEAKVESSKYFVMEANEMKQTIINYVKQLTETKP